MEEGRAASMQCLQMSVLSLALKGYSALRLCVGRERCRDKNVFASVECLNLKS